MFLLIYSIDVQIEIKNSKHQDEPNDEFFPFWFKSCGLLLLLLLFLPLLIFFLVTRPELIRFML